MTGQNPPADALFAETSSGKTPVLLTGDERIYKMLLVPREMRRPAGQPGRVSP